MVLLSVTTAKGGLVRALVTLLALLLVLSPCVAACGTDETPPPVEAAPEYVPEEPESEALAEPEEPETYDDAVSWKQASEFVDELVTVEGPVVGTFYAYDSNGEPTFLNVGKDYPNPSRFTVVIWGDDRGEFPESPEDMYAGCTVRVTGYVELYEGSPQIHISSPGDIEIVD